MKPTLEAIVDGALPFDAELETCIAQLEPVIRAMTQQGIQASAIIAALARLTVVTVGGDRQH